MLTYVLAALAFIVHWAFVGLLLLLCIRTRSKGLIVMFATYVGFMVVGAIFQPFSQQYIDQWVGGKINNWLTERTSVAAFLVVFDLIRRFFYMSLCLIGLILVYKEWRQGKFNQPQPKHPQEL